MDTMQMHESAWSKSFFWSEAQWSERTAKLAKEYKRVRACRACGDEFMENNRCDFCGETTT